MSLENHIQSLDNEFNFLQSYIAKADENWRDFVKEKFFSENLDKIPSEFSDFNLELNNLNQSFKSAENTINSLR